MGTSISFARVPADVRAPGVLVEFDSSRAVGGAPIKPYKVLLAGQRTSGGSVAALTPKRLSSREQARAWFGNGSMLDNIAALYFKNDHESDVIAIALDDNGAGVAATLATTITGPATAAGTLVVYIAGRRVTVAVASGDTASTIATNLAAAVNAFDGIPVTAGAVSATVTFTARHKGTEGNQIDVRLNYYAGETTPAGLALSAVPGKLTGGTTNPTVGANLWSAIGDVQYDVLVLPWTDASNLTAIKTELDDRYGPVRATDGRCFAGKIDTLANLQTFGGTVNSEQSTYLGAKGLLNPPWEVAAAYAALASFHLRSDPARPLRTLELRGILAPEIADRFTYTERDLLYRYGVASIFYGAGDEVLIDRAITSYKTAPSGAPDTSYLDLMTPATLSYLRWDLRRLFASRYPRHKIAADGTRFGQGQVVITPKIAKAEVLSAYQRWEERGLVEDFEGFERDMVSAINAADPTRLDLLLPARLVNPFYTLAAMIQFQL